MCESKKSDDRRKCAGNCGNTDSGLKVCQTCYISTENSTHTRRCFMSGEYCSQKTNIQRERKKLYESKDKEGEEKITISAFVIMNFSDMSDVVYKWRIEIFVKSLAKYLYMDTENNRLYCNVKKNSSMAGMKKVDKIKVVRSDSSPASNYVICSRICQQIQIADLVIVDVSLQNPNVFYEFGMAVALEKLILPICFSESFYKLEFPDEIKKMELKDEEDIANLDDIQHHIGCYPWRKNLFEYYGIRFKQNEESDEPSNTYYLDYDKAVNRLYGFSDRQYKQFPYDEVLKIEENEKEESKKESKEEQIGQILYEELKRQYNNATKQDNTLVVYTMEGFLNEDQAGLCIVNFYHSITERMQKEQCFCGERVGVLVQGHAIPDSDKDAKNERYLLYNVGEIIHIGVNQATYLAAKEKVQAEDDSILKQITNETQTNGASETYQKEIRRFVKEYIGNRGMIVYPDNPVYVERIKNKVTPNILKIDNTQCNALKTFCLYHVMLRTLCYTNEIVVDITNNSPQSLFWLGAAHGAEIYAITVKNELSEKERKIIERDIKNIDRNIFDVAGLWTAYYYSHDTEGFYHQLALAQFGIEKHSKIIPSDATWHGFKKWEYLELHEEDDDKSGEKEGGDTKKQSNDKETQIKNRVALESYYRRRFWNIMLRYNRLRIYLSQHNDKDQNDHNPRLRVAKWDLDAVSELSHYLSKRSVIGEYVLISLPDEEKDEAAEDVNYICVGQHANPLESKLTDHIYARCMKKEEADKNINITHDENDERCGKEREADKNINIIHDHKDRKFNCVNCLEYELKIKGFIRMGEDEKEEGVFSYVTWASCEECSSTGGRTNNMVLNKLPHKNTKYEECPLKGRPAHIEIAQLILWREDGEKGKNNQHFRVAINGSSGPATYGLSSIFVDEDQIFFDFQTEKEMKNENILYPLLYELQEKVRNKIYRLMMEKLEDRMLCILYETEKNLKLNDKAKILKRYCNLVLYSVFSYLRTVFYRYFLPFLTEKDINRIRNDMYMFLNSMKVARQSPFCLDYAAGEESNQCPTISNDGVTKIVQMIPDEVEELLECFKGLEAFYKVEVQHSGNSTCDSANIKDSRTVKNIEMLGDESREINYFIIPKNSKC